MIEQCDGCKCFMPIDGHARRRLGVLSDSAFENIERGFCRRYPPTSEHSGEDLSPLAKVAADGWCGEFKAEDVK